jgi:hypothetical protein
VDGRESAFDLTHSPGEREELTKAMADGNRQFIQQQLERLASQFRFRAQ